MSKRNLFERFPGNSKMDSLDIFEKNEIEEWAIPHLKKIVIEVNESNGKITYVKKLANFIEIMSKISDLTRYDKISKDSLVTYSVPSNFDMLIRSAKFFS